MNASLEQEIENNPNAVVMEPRYTHVFNPWPCETLRSCIDSIAECTKTMSLEQAEATIEGHNKLSEFAKLHPKIYEQLLKKEFVNNEKYMKVIYQMLNLQNEVRMGRMSEVAAKTSVSDQALAAVMKK